MFTAGDEIGGPGVRTVWGVVLPGFAVVVFTSRVTVPAVLPPRTPTSRYTVPVAAAVAIPVAAAATDVLAHQVVQLLGLLLLRDLLVDLVDGLGAAGLPPGNPLVLPQVDEVLQEETDPGGGLLLADDAVHAREVVDERRVGRLALGALK